jgi:hypothetical protein
VAGVVSTRGSSGGRKSGSSRADPRAHVAHAREQRRARPWTRAVGLVHRSIVDRGQGGLPRSNLRRRFKIGRLRWHTSGHTAVDGSAQRRTAVLRRNITGDGGLGATVHYLRRGLNMEKDEDVSELTRGSLTALGRRRRRAAMRGGRDHGCLPGRALRPWLRASERRDEPLVYLCVRG